MEFEDEFLKYAIESLRKKFFHIPEIISIGIGKRNAFDSMKFGCIAVHFNVFQI